MIGRYCLVRTYSAGVHVGILADMKGKEVRLLASRRIWYWKGAFTLNELAQNGCNSESKLSILVPEIVLTEAIEVLPMSNEAEKIVREMKAHATS